jgi:hypothetical protein
LSLGGEYQTIRLMGGPYDGLHFRLGVDMEWPDEIVFGHDGPPTREIVYRIDPGCLLDLRQCLVSRRRLYRYQPAGAVAEL